MSKNFMEGNQKIRPLFSNVIVKKDDSEEKSKTGIIIGSDENPALVGTVISVGKELTEEIKPGDKIMYAPFSGRELGGFLILAEHDIMGVVEEEKKEEGNCVCTAACGAGLGHNIKMKCKNCGTEGRPEENQTCPNCSKNDWEKI
jgi:chaperonin GroES